MKARLHIKALNIIHIVRGKPHTFKYYGHSFYLSTGKTTIKIRAS
jgi:hypothetical protein